MAQLPKATAPTGGLDLDLGNAGDDQFEQY
jgi:hypothetical protein